MLRFAFCEQFEVLDIRLRAQKLYSEYSCVAFPWQSKKEMKKIKAPAVDHKAATENCVRVTEDGNRRTQGTPAVGNKFHVLSRRQITLRLYFLKNASPEQGQAKEGERKKEREK